MSLKDLIFNCTGIQLNSSGFSLKGFSVFPPCSYTETRVPALLLEEGERREGGGRAERWRIENGENDH